ncbi:bacterial Ig-like domain-containing protein [Lentilactobacillus parabuchneri]|uniref:bacterial Ig-like domain-containing protein n=1 Tax=Lentilactobacillus parabuchneri TaxID=152331 RepID=UPI000A0F9670|nr:bacterial Ig-like domain-containing protein [Lentilactobacillus parabuchneri]ORN09663.1 Bacterial Ig-like domain (group 3) [Lentilactobacillus parabuchneri]ORN23064.1 Bacterial Ig-like domain (group 3) [Lentilactobacillus parabuchneri]
MYKSKWYRFAFLLPLVALSVMVESQHSTSADTISQATGKALTTRAQPASIKPISNQMSSVGLSKVWDSGDIGTAHWEITDGAVAGTQTLTIDGGVAYSQPHYGNVPVGYYPWDLVKYNITTLNITGPLQLRGDTTRNLFCPLSDLKTITGMHYLDTSLATNMSGMFGSASGFTNSDISYINTSNVTDMSVMFAESSLPENPDLSRFDTRKVTNMFAMFRNIPNLTSLDLSNFDTHNVTTMTDMFKQDTNLWKLKLGSNAVLSRDTKLPEAPAFGTSIPDPDHPGYVVGPKTSDDPKWQDIGSGTDHNPNGPKYYSGDISLATQKADFSGGTYVWQQGPSVPDQTAIDVDQSKTIDNGETFDPSTVFNSITKPDGTKITNFNDAKAAGLTVSGDTFDTKDTGDHTVTFTYNGKTATTTVTVLPPVVDQTAIDVDSTKTINNGTSFDPSSVFQSITKADGTKITNFNDAKAAGMTVSGDNFSTTATGDHTVTFTYNGKAATCKVTVLPVVSDLTAIDVDGSKVINNGDAFSAQSVFHSITKPDGTKVTDFNIAKADGMTVSGDNFNTSVPGNHTVTFSYNGKTATTIVSVLAVNDKTSLNVHDVVLNIGDNWNPSLGFTSATDKFGNVIAFGQISASGFVNTSVAGTYQVTYTYGGIIRTISVYVQAKNTPINPIPVPQPNNNGGSTSNNGGSSSSNNTNGNNLPTYVASKGSVVYAGKKIYMYKNGTFKKSERIAKYPKQKRVDRPMFVVTGYAHSSDGILRYKVRDVNHGSKTAGKTGYITANRKYVTKVYYQSIPWDKTITVISPNGVHSYKHKNLTERAKTYKKGTHLRVKAIVKHNLTTRYKLTNGHYITANKKLVIQGKY